jgi:hypothetical protein
MSCSMMILRLSPSYRSQNSTIFTFFFLCLVAPLLLSPILLVASLCICNPIRALDIFALCSAVNT